MNTFEMQKTMLFQQFGKREIIVLSLLIVICLALIPQVYYCIQRQFYRSFRKKANAKGKKYSVSLKKEIHQGIKELTLTNIDGFNVSAILYEVKEPKALVQIIHGALEHKGRYNDFIRFLNDNGYVVIASDNRGHGLSVNKEYPPVYMNGVDEIIDDQYMVTQYIKGLYPGKELFLVGHSLGSIFARIYLQEHDDQIKKLVLSGTAQYVKQVNLGVFLGRILTFYTKKHGYNKLLSIFNGGDRTDISWISYNEENLQAIANDPLCQYKFQNGGILTVFEADNNLKKYKKYKTQNPDLQILSVTGKEDIAVTGGEQGLADTVASLNKIGYSNVKSIVYPNMKHEVLNETDRLTVFEDILRFFESSIF